MLFIVCLPDVPSESIEKYDRMLVHLLGWGSEERNGKTSSMLERVQIEVFPQR